MEMRSVLFPMPVLMLIFNKVFRKKSVVWFLFIVFAFLPNNLIYTNSDINTGVNIIRHALCYPIKQICSNAGISGNVIIDKIISRERQPIKHVVYIGNDQEGTYIPNPEMQNYGYNAKTNEFGDLIEMGVIDPAKAVRVALENAASVAGLFLTTECVIVDDID